MACLAFLHCTDYIPFDTLSKKEDHIIEKNDAAENEGKVRFDEKSCIDIIIGA